MEFVVLPESDRDSGERNPGSPAREFKLGRSVLRCWEHDSRHGFRSITCRTFGPDRSAVLDVYFSGEISRVPLFYQILNGIETTLP